MIRVEIEEMKKGLYCSYVDGEKLVEESDMVEFDTCRVLLSLGFSGRVETYSVGGTVPRMRMSVAKGASMGVYEGVDSGPRFVKWHPHPRSLAR